jgi:hypothetical protein
MYVEVDAMDGCTYLSVLKHTLCTVTERKDAYTCAADRSLSCYIVHVSIRDSLRSNVSLHP